MRELAAHYVQLICKEQRHGPYFLGGYSYGGIVAYEMASLLTEQNQRVEFVAMIDTFPWFPPPRTVSNRLASMHGDRNFEIRHVQVRERGHRCNSSQVSHIIAQTLLIPSLQTTATIAVDKNSRRRFVQNFLI